MRTPVKSSTMAGPDTKAKASVVMITRSARPSSRAGPERAGPVTTTTTGTMPEQAARARAARPHPCSEATPSDTSAPLEASTITMRDAQVEGRGRRRPHGLAVLDGQRPPAEGGHRPHHHGRPPAELLDAGPHRSGDQSTEDRCGGGLKGHRPMLRIPVDRCASDCSFAGCGMVP